MKRNRVVLLCVLALSGLIMTGATYNDYLRKIATVICYDIVVNNSVEVTGAIALGDDATMENGEIVTNGTDAVVGVTFDDDASELGDLQVYSSNTGTADTDYFRASWYFEDSSSEKTECAQFDVNIDDQTTATEDVTLEWAVITAGALAGELELDGASLNPTTDAGLDLGKTAQEFNDLYIDGTANIDTLSADAVSSIAGHDEVRVAAFSFYDVDVAASQSAAAWGVDASASVGGASFAAIPMPLAGSVIGISVYSNDACTSGSLTADATINTTATGLQAVLNDTVTTTAVTMQANDADTFTAGQLLGVKVTTTSPWVPTTADAIVVVWVEY